MSRQRFGTGINPGSLSADPTTNVKAGDMYYNTTTNKHKVYNGTVWSEVGSGSGSGGKNYLTSYNGNTGNGDFELSNTTGWSLFNTTFSNNLPTTITAGASSITTFDTVTGGSQLAKTFSLQTDSSTSLTVGHGFISDAFTIDTEDQAKAWSFAFTYKLAAGGTTANFSGTSANTYAVFIYDVDNTTWLQPAGVYNLVQKTGIGIASGTFQTSATGTQYRIAVVCYNAYASPITMYWDSFSIGPNSKVQGAAISDWQTYTPTISWTANATPTGKWRRVGDSIEIDALVSLSGAPTPASSLTISTPSGLSIDTSKLTSATSELNSLGTAIIYDNAGGSLNSRFAGHVIGSSATSVVIMTVDDVNTTTHYLDKVTPTYPFTFAASDSIHIRFIAPVAGWSSNTVVSDSTDTREVSFKIERSATATSLFTAASVIKQTYDVAPTIDTHGGWDSGNNRYIIPVSGTYEIFGAIYVSALATIHTSNLRLRKNGNDITQDPWLKETTSAVNFPYRTSTIIKCNAGDYIELFFDNQSGSTLNSLGTGSTQVNRLVIKRLSGPSVIAATETVSLICNPQTATGTITSTPSVAKLATVTRDTHGMYNTVSGLATIPVSGWYHLDGKTDITTSGIAAGQYYAASFMVNGSNFAENFFVVGTTSPASGTTHTSVTRYLNAGDTVGLGARSNATSPVYSSGLSGSFLSITKMGI